MNKTAIKNFAIFARKKLMQGVELRCRSIGIMPDMAKDPDKTVDGMDMYSMAPNHSHALMGAYKESRKRLLDRIKQLGNGEGYAAGYPRFVEEVAYTWFNRIIAIRFMEINDYLPSHVRVLSSATPGKRDPDIISQMMDADLDLTSEDLAYVNFVRENAQEDYLFQFLFISQCNKLNEVLPGLFEPLAGYTDLLLELPYTDPDGVIQNLLKIPEEDFDIKRGGQVEIIGWLYQYYNTELKDETFALLKKNVKITKQRIPAATQLFTPDWIVRYMVENSLGRLWVEGHPSDALKSGWNYYLEEAEQESDVQVQLEKIRAGYKTIKPEEIKVIDPCMGSGHILVYAFDVLMSIYKSCGYTERDATRLIVEKNLYGLDIDKRAYQLAYFAVMMKARQYDRRFLTRSITPNLCAIAESNGANRDLFKLYPEKLWQGLEHLLDVFIDAREYGSILNMPDIEWDIIEEETQRILNETYDNMFDSIRQYHVRWELAPLLQQGRIMAQKYDVVVTNPPYMGSSGMSGKLAKHVKDNYPDSKSDLFAVFMERCGEMTAKDRYTAMITQHAWMFLSSFEKLRDKLLQKDTINMAHLGARAFDEIGGEVVQTTSFVLRKSHTPGYKGTYCRLIEPTTEKGKEDMFLAGENRYTTQQDNFSKIPGSPVAYWVSEAMLKTFESGITIGTEYRTITGSSTGENAVFLKLWHEVCVKHIGFNITSSYSGHGFKWILCNKGGSFRRWFGNNEYIINWENDGLKLKAFATMKNSGKHWSRFLKSLDMFYHEGISWSKVTSGEFCCRYMPEGFIMESAACAIMPKHEDINCLLALMNTKIVQAVLRIKNPTINMQTGDIIAIPIIGVNMYRNAIEQIVNHNISISQADWDSFETSWDFKRHPLLDIGGTEIEGDNGEWIKVTSIKWCYEVWKSICNTRFKQLKANEEELNRIFIEIYGLQDELTPVIEDKDVTVRHADLGRDIRSFISYAVGCMFGRYSLDVEGLAYAGGEWDGGKYSTFIPDRDNVLPITDEEYFEDDIVGLFVAFVKKVYGAETLEENLDFIAKALESKGDTSREIIRNYFLKDFYKDHCKVYQKRPIYWLFDSGKQNGFKALIYMHRYDKYTVSRVRTDYLHKMQVALESGISMCNNIMESAASPGEKAKAVKRKEKLVKQLEETRLYDQAIAHIANQYIDIDLDDGVKVNYAKFQGVEVSSQGKKAQRVNLLGEV